MYISKLFAVYFTILMLLLAPLLVKGWADSSMGAADMEIKQKIDAAVTGAAEEIILINGNAFQTESQRTRVLNGFYGSLGAAFNKANENFGINTVAAYIPCVVLADRDGVYACYEKGYRTWNSKKGGYGVTPITTYTTSYTEGGDSYGITFYMDGTAQIRKNGEFLAKGGFDSLAEVAIRLASEGNRIPVSFLPEEETEDAELEDYRRRYEEERERVITGTIQNTVQAWLNPDAEQNSSYFQMDLSAAGKFDTPAVLAFFTGDGIMRDGVRQVHCIMSGAGLSRNKRYFLKKVDGHLFYHAEFCPKAELSAEEKETGCTLKQAGIYGASACPYCIR